MFRWIHKSRKKESGIEVLNEENPQIIPVNVDHFNYGTMVKS